jgi:hypothetical protein
MDGQFVRPLLHLPPRTFCYDWCSWRDFWIFTRSNHPLLSVFMVDPLHPFSKWERFFHGVVTVLYRQFTRPHYPHLFSSYFQVIFVSISCMPSKLHLQCGDGPRMYHFFYTAQQRCLQR